MLDWLIKLKIKAKMNRAKVLKLLILQY